ncbi:hypothetical protein E2C01_038383 [Portunus trituberculatus]|uniref:Uncharacterized protein n=1 Tax=Portunus trituberculatus TaxID=210409 RepID=A0A5B7FK17_PORTR|nr:hypothetical protein [Portunus trituberculatus]
MTRFHIHSGNYLHHGTQQQEQETNHPIPAIQSSIFTHTPPYFTLDARTPHTPFTPGLITRNNRLQGALASILITRAPTCPRQEAPGLSYPRMAAFSVVLLGPIRYTEFLALVGQPINCLAKHLSFDTRYMHSTPPGPCHVSSCLTLHQPPCTRRLRHLFIVVPACVASAEQYSNVLSVKLGVERSSRYDLRSCSCGDSHPSRVTSRRPRQLSSREPQRKQEDLHYRRPSSIISPSPPSVGNVPTHLPFSLGPAPSIAERLDLRMLSIGSACVASPALPSQ